MSLIKNAAGTTLITLGDTAPVGGYQITSYAEGDRQHEEFLTSSKFVDDDYEYQDARAKGIRNQLNVYIEGTDWADATAKHNALLDAVQVRQWQLVIAGVTWICRKADSTSPMPPLGPDSDWREVSLFFGVKLQRGV